MAYEADSIHPRNAKKLEEVERLLLLGRAKLTGSKAENVIIPDPLFALLTEAVLIRLLNAGEMPLPAM